MNYLLTLLIILCVTVRLIAVISSKQWRITQATSRYVVNRARGCILNALWWEQIGSIPEATCKEGGSMVSLKLLFSGRAKTGTMAKQSGPIKIKGTISGITFYKQEDTYLARQKSSLTGKRVKTDPAFTNTMKEADILKHASQLASFVYRQLPNERKRRHYQLLTGQAQQQLRKGMNKDGVITFLFAYAAREWNLNGV